MNILYESKDLDPKITVENAKRFLKSINCNPTYECKKNLSGTYSATLDGSKWGLTSFGKGITPELCEASAYGEFIERLQNLNHGLYFNVLNTEEINNRAYQNWPDEKQSLLYNTLIKNPEITNAFCEMFKFSNNYNITPSILEITNIVSTIIDSPVCHEVPYYEIFSHKKRYFPLEVLSVLIGTTGECAGNTPEEALVQGLSEVLERFAESTVIKNKLTPPEIPLSYIKSIEPEIYNLIETFLINTNNRFNIKFYDMSFEKGIPVISTIIFDKKYPRYRMQSGSHPLFKIALERCLTELEQELFLMDDSYIESNFINWDISSSTLSDKVDNIASQSIGGNGAVPNEWFFSKPSWKFTPWKTFDIFNNKIALTYLLDIFKESNLPVYIRDTTLSELYTFLIYVPNISQFYINIKDSFLYADMYLWAQKLDVEWENCLYDEKLRLLDYIKNFGYKILGPVYADISQCYLATAIALELGDLDGALYFISQGFQDNRQTQLIKKEIELRIQGIPEKERDDCLLKFFSNEEINILYNIWRKEGIIYSLYGQDTTDLDDTSLDATMLSTTNKLLFDKISETFCKDKEYEYLSWIN